MRIWIKSTPVDSCIPDFVLILTEKPNQFGGTKSGFIDACRKHVRKLLKGTGVELPRHGSADVVSVNITATCPNDDLKINPKGYLGTP